MTFSFHPEAETELLEAIEYYEEREPGLGYDFSIEVFATIQNIIAYPSAWPVVEEGIRRCLVNRFPYGVIYSIEQDEVLHPCRNASAPTSRLLEEQILIRLSTSPIFPSPACGRGVR